MCSILLHYVVKLFNIHLYNVNKSYLMSKNIKGSCFMTVREMVINVWED